MYLSKLSLHGFKSFADQTELHFSPGITAIVGPNGCGKSNIVDAVRWVIGEQRASVLRSDKMNDVIFNGTSRRRALGMSEVQLTIENNRGVLPTEYSEVSIGRRLYRSGDSEYLMNDVQSRLKDIQNLFMDTGMGADAYSVIELKMIEEIISDSTEDRRHMFEEAAGISKYKQRRRQALRKLEQTQADLDRVRDLTDEVAKNVRRLKRQAKKASQYRDVKARLDELELSLAQAEYDRLQDKKRRLAEQLGALSDDLEARTTQIATAEAALEEHKKQIVDREQTLSARQQELSKHLEGVRELETERRLENERLENARKDQSRTRDALHENQGRQEEVAESLERLSRQLSEARPVLAEAKETVEEALADRKESEAAAESREATLNELRSRRREADEAVGEQRRAVDRLASRLDHLEADRRRLVSEREDLQQEIAGRSSALEDAAQELERHQQRTDEALEERRRVEDERTSADEELEEALAQLHAAERERDGLAAEVELLSSLVSSYEEFSDAVQFLAADGQWSDAPLKTVSDVLGCSEDVLPALQSALGPLAECIVVADEEELHAAMRQLRREERGRATFIVRSRLDGGSETTSAPGGSAPSHTTATPEANAAAPLSAHVRADEPENEVLISRLLRGSYLVDSLEQATALAVEQRGRFYTRSGEWCDGDGITHGGSTSDASGATASSRFQRREQLGASRRRLETLEEELADYEERVAGIRQKKDALPLETASEKAAAAEKALAAAEKRHERLAYEHEQLKQREAHLTTRIEETAKTLDERRSEHTAEEETLEKLKDELASVRAESRTAEEDFKKADRTNRSAVSAHNEAHVAMLQARNHVENLEREKERTERNAKEIDERLVAQSDHLTQLREQIEASESRLASLKKEIFELQEQREGFDARVHEARTALTDVKSAVSEKEKLLRELRSEREAIIRKENELNVTQAQVETRTEDLLEDLSEDYGRNLDANPVPLGEDFDESAAKEEVKTLRKKVQRIGVVNPLALEQFDEEQERLDFLTEQREDLEKAENTLLDTITEINSTATDRFTETFEAVRENFQGLFQRLFRGDAQADLTLDDPTNPLDCDINITAKPSGKRPSVLSQLSSGEKTLTAIALLFGIYLVKPSPFCILDEVDAPLDDMNVERFMHLLKEFDDRTQFIIVTHNKLTMEAADRLYGITMQEQGVSKLVGVHFDEAVKMVA